MSRPKNHATDHTVIQQPRTTPSAGLVARERLLAELSVIERRLRLNGVSTAVLEGGAGPPIVLLHGPGEYGAKWLRVIPELVETHRVIAPDLPGHGSSEPLREAVQAELVVAWLDDLIECTCSTAPVLVGQILGGAIAARFAIERGDRVEMLVLVDSLGLTTFQPAPEFGSALMAFVEQPTEETHERLWRRCTFDLDAMRSRLGERWDWIAAYNVDRANAAELRATAHGLMEHFGMPAIPPAQLARIAVPTALIWGRHDLATPLSVAQDVSSRYGWPLHVIDNAADDPPMEQPESFLRALRTVLAAAKEDAEATTERRDARAEPTESARGRDATSTPAEM